MGGDVFCFAEGPGVPENPKMGGRKYSIFQNSSCPRRDRKKKRALPTPRSSHPRGTVKRSLGPTQPPRHRLTFVTPIDRRMRRDPNRTEGTVWVPYRGVLRNLRGSGVLLRWGERPKDPPIHPSRGGGGGVSTGLLKKLGSGSTPPPRLTFDTPIDPCGGPDQPPISPPSGNLQKKLGSGSAPPPLGLLSNPPSIKNLRKVGDEEAGAALVHGVEAVQPPAALQLRDGVQTDGLRTPVESEGAVEIDG